MYFWAYESDPTVARALAIGWVTAANRRNAYAPTVPKSCGVVYAQVEIPAVECLDCSTVSFEEALNQTLGLMRAISDDDLGTAYQTVISRLEDKLQVKYRVIHARVSPPKGMAFVQHKFVGNPVIHLVRSGWEDIKVTNFEEVPLAA